MIRKNQCLHPDHNTDVCIAEYYTETSAPKDSPPIPETINKPHLCFIRVDPWLNLIPMTENTIVYLRHDLIYSVIRKNRRLHPDRDTDVSITEHYTETVILSICRRTILKCDLQVYSFFVERNLFRLYAQSILEFYQILIATQMSVSRNIIQ